MDDKDNKDNKEPKLPLSDDSKKLSVNNDQTSNISKNRLTTQSVAESLARIRSELGQSQELQKPSITLNILGVDTPIVFADKVQITIGRKNPATNEHPDVDLSGLPLNFAGISRKHVNLVYTNGQWFAEDLGSRNGTWLNSKLLMAYQRYQITDGDQLRVAGISVIIVTRADVAQVNRTPSQSKTSLPDSLALTTPSVIEDQKGLSVGYTENHLMPYISAVIDMMQHVDHAKKRPQREISIISIEFNNPTISVHLTCAHEVLQFLNKQQLVIKAPETTEAMQSIDMTADISATHEKRSTEIARQFAEEHFPLITADQSLRYQQLLAPLLKVCIESDIRVVV
jgi:pSer/pThr/pTyr-binding forkhead associated (FHA) protein